MLRGRLLLYLAMAALVLCGVPGTAAASTAAGDFDGDGRDDLAVGVPLENIGAATDGGAVNVIYGAAGGLTTTGDQLFTQNTGGVIGVSEGNDRFGAALAVGDFNADGRADLVIGVPGENGDSGAVNVLYGSAGGLTTSGDQFVTQNSSGIQGVSGFGDRFGAALAAGASFVAIGVPGEDLAPDVDAGAVNVVFGSATGLTSSGNRIISQKSPGIQGFAEDGDRFGSAVSVGSLGGAAAPDLAVGAPGENVFGRFDAGAVNVIYDNTTSDEVFTQATGGIKGTADSTDRFGAALTAGDATAGVADFDNDGLGDLAVGVPGEDRSPLSNIGAVNVIYQSGGSLNPAGDQLITQSTPGIKGASGNTDDFGTALSAADFDNDGDSDLAIGVPGETLGSATNAGAVNVILGSGTGLTSTGDQLFTQNTGIQGVAGVGDAFGRNLASGQFNNAARFDLAVGAPGENLGSIVDAGVVHAIFGSSSGLTSAGDQLFSQNTPGIQGVAGNGDRFG